MKKSELYLLVQEVLTESGLGRVLNEDISFNPVLIFENVQSDIKDLEQKAQSAGVNLDNPEDMEKLAQSVMNADFDLNKVNVKAIQEIQIPLNEGTGVFGAFLEGTKWLKVVEAVVATLKLGKAVSDKIKKFFKALKNAAGWVFKMIEKAIYKIATFLGADIETARMAGISGLIVLGIISVAFAIAAFPSLVSAIFAAVGTVAISKAIFGLLVGLVKGWAGIKSLWEKFTKGATEKIDKVFTPADFFDNIKPILIDKAKKANLKFKNIPFDWVYGLESFMKHLSTKGSNPELNVFQKRLSTLTQNIKSGKVTDIHFKNIYNELHGDKKATEIFQKIQAIMLPKTTSDTDYYGTNSSFNESKLISAIKSLKEENIQDREYIQLLSRILDRLKSIDDTSNSSDIVKKLEDLDTSLDYIAGALTGKDPLDIGANQAYFGRLSSPKKSKK